MISPHRLTSRRCALALLLFALCACAAAGPGPQNVAVVINGDSWGSKTVANEFIRLRGIPPSNVIYLDRLPEFEQTDVEFFRESIIRPVMETLARRGVVDQIDCVAYSSDIPFRINVSEDKKKGDFNKIITPWASINGLTYLYRHVLSGDLGYLNLDVNRYARRSEPELNARPIPPQLRDEYAAAMKLFEGKKWQEARDALKLVAAGAPGSPDVLYNLGCAMARTDDTDGAMSALGASVDAGYLNFAHMLTDKDLEPLRERADFKQLVADMKTREFRVQPTQGFSADYKWSSGGQPGASGGPSYLLSVMLAVTSGRGNSVGEALGCLKRARSADATRPDGTIYYMVNGDIRSGVRQWGFTSAVRDLERLGIKAEAIDGKLPREKQDVAGLMAGSPGFDWPDSKSRILPGAICEHLTSFGGIMVENISQTPLTEFIRRGAAGASGTVTEPFAINAKFPDPFIHLRYAEGSTLAEAFYQSVTGPYQLLIVGDPLCRPWADVPVIELEGAARQENLSGHVALRGSSTSDGQPIARYELFVDGKRYAIAQAGEEIRLDTRQYPDGYHELTMVGVRGDAVGTRGEVRVPVIFDNLGNSLRVQPPAHKAVTWGGQLKLAAQMSGEGKITFHYNQRLAGTIDGASGEIEISTVPMGLGPVTIHPVGILGEEGKPGVPVLGEPIEIVVIPPPPLPPIEVPAKPEPAKGVLLAPEGGDAVVVESTQSPDWLEKAGVKEGQAFTLSGEFPTPADDVYQFQIRTDGEAVLTVDDARLGELTEDRWVMAPVTLAKGVHRFSVEGKAGPKSRLDLRFGGPGALSVGAPRFHHRRTVKEEDQ